MEIRKVLFKVTEKDFSTQLTWNIELTHDEIVALSRAVLFYAETEQSIITSSIEQMNDELTTLCHLHTLAGKLPDLEG